MRNFPCMELAMYKSRGRSLAYTRERQKYMENGAAIFILGQIAVFVYNMLITLFPDFSRFFIVRVNQCFPNCGARLPRGGGDICKGALLLPKLI